MHLKNAAIFRFEKRIVGSAGMAEGNESQTLQRVTDRKLALKLLQERVSLTGKKIAPRLHELNPRISHRTHCSALPCVPQMGYIGSLPRRPN
jgi:hypothetical protein